MPHEADQEAVREILEGMREPGPDDVLLALISGGEPRQINLENLKTPDDTWKLPPIYEDFHRLMSEMEGV